MTPGFSFDGAIGHAFRAPHFKTFPWIFGLSYALIGTLLLLLLGWMARSSFNEVVATMEALDQTNPDPETSQEVFGILFGAMAPLYPYFIVLMIGSWIFWAMFEAASQRRYIWDQSFSLKLGGDEMRMAVVGLLWYGLGLLLYALPIFAIFGSAISSLVNDAMQNRDPGNAAIGAMFGAFGLMILLFPVYVFIATRLAPCFGLTMKDRKIRFFDAWNVSRGRFWPILGAYIILAFGAGIVSSVITQIFQMALMPFIVSSIENIDESNIGEIFTSPLFLTMMGLYLFISLFFQGVVQHIVGAPAAFAARRDPRGGVDDVRTVDTFV